MAQLASLSPRLHYLKQVSRDKCASTASPKHIYLKLTLNRVEKFAPGPPPTKTRGIQMNQKEPMN